MMRTMTMTFLACLAIMLSLCSNALADDISSADVSMLSAFSSPTDETSSEDVGVSPSRTGPMLLIMTGGLVTLGGIAVIALDEDSYTAAAGQDQRESYWDTMPAGMATAGAGLVIIGLGTYWYAKRTTATATTSAGMLRSRSKWAAVIPSARVTSTAVSLGWTVTF